jgi:hypothetical protein
VVLASGLYFEKAIMIKHKAMNNIKKVSLTLILFIVGLANVNGQKLSAGLYGAFSTGTVKISEIPSEAVNSIEANSFNGVELGLYAKLKIATIYIKPMALLNYRRGRIEVNSNDNSTTSDRFSFSKFEVPVLFGYNIIGPLSIEAGPVYNYILTYSDNINNTDVLINRSGLGYRVGLAAEISRLMITASYQGLRTSSSSDNISTFKSPNELLFGLGLRFGEDKSKKDKDKEE